MSQTLSVSPIQMYYWKVKFADSYVLSQFNEDGSENQVQDFCGAEHWELKDGVKSLKWHSNLFSNIEKMHGRATHIGWYPFEIELALKIKSRNSEYNIHLVNSSDPHELAIPDNGFAFMKKEIEFNWISKTPLKGPNGDLIYDKSGNQMFLTNDPSANQSDLYYGYLMRDGSAQGDVRHAKLHIREVLE